MNIAMFSDTYYPAVNGISTSIQTLAEYLVRAGHKVMIIAPDFPKDMVADDGLFGIGVYYLRLPSKPVKDNQSERCVCPGVFFKWDPLRQFAPEVIHVHTTSAVGELGVKWARRLHVPCVATVNSIPEYTEQYAFKPHFWAAFCARRSCKKFCHQFDAVIAPSNYVADYLRKLKIRRPITVVPTAVSFPLFKGGDMCEAAKYVPNPGTAYLLCVGRLSKEKKLDFIWQAFMMLKPRYPSLRLVVVGDGNSGYRQHLEGLTQLMNLGNSVIFTGAQPRDRLKHFYALARCLVFAAENEAQNSVLLEAQAAGSPIVAVRSGSVEEIVRDGATGFLVDPGDLQGFVERVIRVIENGDVFNALSRNARSWASRFDPADMAANVHNLYCELGNKAK